MRVIEALTGPHFGRQAGDIRFHFLDFLGQRLKPQIVDRLMSRQIVLHPGHALAVRQHTTRRTSKRTAHVSPQRPEQPRPERSASTCCNRAKPR